MTVYTVLTIFLAAVSIPVRRELGIRGKYMSRGQLLNAVCLFGIFIFMFIVSAFRYKVGNDYPRYEEFFHLIPLNQVVPTEAGFNILVRLLQFMFGLYNNLAIFAFFSFVTTALMVKAVWDLSENFLFSFGLFLCFGYYFQSLNTVRYYVAFAAALFAMKYVLQRDWPRFLAVILVAATIHKSVLVVIPAYILASFTWKRYHYVLLALLGAVAFVLRSPLLKFILVLYPSYEGTQYLDGGTSYVNILRILGVLALCLLCRLKSAYNTEPAYNLYFNLNFMALVLFLGGSFIPEVSRLGHYLIGAHVFLIPRVILSVENVKLRRTLMVLTALAAVLYFAVFLFKAQELLVRIVPYHTWLFGTEW